MGKRPPPSRVLILCQAKLFELEGESFVAGRKFTGTVFVGLVGLLVNVLVEGADNDRTVNFFAILVDSLTIHSKLHLDDGNIGLGNRILNLYDVRELEGVLIGNGVVGCGSTLFLSFTPQPAP